MKLKLNKLKGRVSDPIILIENNFQEDLDKIQATFKDIWHYVYSQHTIFFWTMSFLAKI